MDFLTFLFLLLCSPFIFLFGTILLTFVYSLIVALIGGVVYLFTLLELWIKKKKK